MKYFFITFSLSFLILFSLAPYYLAYENPPLRSDAIVLLVGSDNDVRWQKVQELINQDYSQYLIIPAYGQIFMDSKDGQLILIKKLAFIDRKMNNSPKQMNRKIYEDTHIEILRSKRMMDDWGFRSVIFVSEPYHMRRIELIAGRVFDKEEYNLVFVPTSSDNSNSFFWWVDKVKRRWVLSEYLKILWFLLYEPFSRISIS